MPPRDDARRLGAELSRVARPLSADADLDPLIERIGDARYVLLGEATHGTSEFYRWRDRLSRRLIAEQGFSFVAVEGDWPDCYRINGYVKGWSRAGNAREVLRHFERWPTWMWANTEVAGFAEWMRRYNSTRPVERMAGFYGLDVYSLWESIHAVTQYLDERDPELARQARQAYACFDPYYEDPQEYARATALVPTSCADEAVAVLTTLRGEAAELKEDGGDAREAYFNAEQNALTARNAEMYYRTMIRGGSASWNLRDHHMVETLERLMAHHGPQAKAIAWEHNTHVGDARFTDMAAHGMVNVGQIVRERHGKAGVVLVGFGTHHGTVIAAEEWAQPMQRMQVPDARPGSFEDACHEAGRGDFLLVFENSVDGGIGALGEPWDHRAIGVVYDPHRERWGNYVPTMVPGRYDAFMYVEESKAVGALHLEARVTGEEATFPSGM